MNLDSSTRSRKEDNADLSFPFHPKSDEMKSSMRKPSRDEKRVPHMAIIDQEVYGLNEMEDVGDVEAAVISQEYLQNNNISMKGHPHYQ